MSSKSGRRRRKVGRFLQKELKKVGHRVKKQQPVLIGSSGQERPPEIRDTPLNPYFTTWNQFKNKGA
ncbi:hypothetical protein SAMN04488137_4550 [Fictibacillus solisalsi]|uniref:Uncharacterized protein n=1 Tax=Fictibacillus solisalsi TaxID=459525 RepID=A0A1H0BLH3_9BACL|nr:hypothetical protein [Fictibacillus solisalsi]SDN46490.1 hypothetical protein SAMN04488137_4550 [Fictibacillus solisalsi]